MFTTATVAAAPRLLGAVRVTQASAAVPRLLASPMEDVHDGAYRVEYSKTSFDSSCAEMGVSSLIGYTAADSRGNDEQPYQPCLGLSISVGTVQLYFLVMIGIGLHYSSCAGEGSRGSVISYILVAGLHFAICCPDGQSQPSR